MKRTHFFVIAFLFILLLLLASCSTREDKSPKSVANADVMDKDDESEEFSTISVDEAVKIVKNADTPLEPIIGISKRQNDDRLSIIKNNANIQIGAKIKSITEKGIIVSVISLPPTVISDKENCDLLKIGDECIVKCSFKFEYDSLLENSYWIIGIYDPLSNTITVEDSSLFWCSKLYPHNN